MAGSSSGKAAYWIGALTGLIFSIALVSVLSVLGDRNGDVASGTRATPEATATPEVATSAPSQPSTAGTAEPAATQPAAQQQAAAPEPAPQPAPAATPTPTPTPSATPAPAAQQPEPVQQAQPAAPATEEDARPAAVAETAPAIIGGPGALVDHSEFFNGDPSEPILAIVLFGVGGGGAPADDIFLMPAPLTVAIDASVERASSLVLDARDSGFEALLTLSEDASGPDDLAARLAKMDGVIGIAAAGSSLSNNAAINDVLGAIGSRGMALFDATAEGGSAGFRTAKGMGLAAAPLGRAFDETPSSAMVFQSLERAAFDARRTGAFVVIGQADPAVLTGLRRWMNVKAGKSVAVAPFSEVVRRLRNQ